MSNFNIHGQECNFRGVPFSTLEAYGPITKTWLVVWRTNDACANLYLRYHLSMLEHITAIDRLFQFDIEGGYYAALFDYESGTTMLMTHFDTYLRILAPGAYLLVNPYHDKHRQDDEERLRHLYSADDELIQIYRNSRFAGKPQVRELVNDILKIHADTADEISSHLEKMRDAGQPNTSTSC